MLTSSVRPFDFMADFLKIIVQLFVLLREEGYLHQMSLKVWQISQPNPFTRSNRTEEDAVLAANWYLASNKEETSLSSHFIGQLEHLVKFSPVRSEQRSDREKRQWIQYMLLECNTQRESLPHLRAVQVIEIVRSCLLATAVLHFKWNDENDFFWTGHMGTKRAFKIKARPKPFIAWLGDISVEPPPPPPSVSSFEEHLGTLSMCYEGFARSNFVSVGTGFIEYQRLITVILLRFKCPTFISN